jgi:hypothetical protein
VEDFGAQGEAPTNPALLDWLASTFMDRGWNMRSIIREIVTSDAYKRSSKPLPVHDHQGDILTLQKGDILTLR